MSLLIKMPQLTFLTHQPDKKFSTKSPCSLNESEAGSGSIDLPYVQLFVLFDALINLVRLEALGQALLHHIVHLDRLAALFWGHLTNHSVDLVCNILLPENKAM